MLMKAMLCWQALTTITLVCNPPDDEREVMRQKILHEHRALMSDPFIVREIDPSWQNALGTVRENMSD